VVIVKLPGVGPLSPPQLVNPSMETTQSTAAHTKLRVMLHVNIAWGKPPLGETLVGSPQQ